MGVALPHLMKDLSITATAAQWLTTAFMLTMAVVIPITGFLIQRFHTRPVFITAMTLFSTGTLIAALAPGFEVLLLGRIVQASGTAIMMPLLMTTVTTLVAPASRGKTMGNISIVISVAPAIGPTISGIILSILDWRWMFILVLPIAIGALLLGASRIKNVTTPRQVPLDLLSVVLSAFGFGGFVYGLSNLGGTAAAGWVPLGIGLVALALFVLRQLHLQRNNRALLDLRVFTSRIFTLSISMLMITHIGMSAGLSLLFTPLFTSGLGSLKPNLYSHGSAVVGTVQQLAGAAGTALFIAVMTSQSAALTAQGVNEVSATASGIRGAFLCGTIIPLFAIPAAFFVRRPPLGEPVAIGH